MGTYLAILSGTIAGGLMILKENGIYWVGGLVVTIATLGWLFSMFIPPTKPIDPSREVSFRIVKRTKEMFADVYPMRKVFGSMLAISWFWLVGSMFCDLLLKGKVTSKYVPAAYGIAIASVLLWYFSSHPSMPEGTPIIDAWTFFRRPENFIITACLFVIAFC